MPTNTFSPSQRPGGEQRVQSMTASGPGLPPASPTPAAAAVKPMQSASADPAYLAYLRGAGVEEGALNNVLGTRVSALVRQLGRELPAYADKRERAVEGAGNAAESRGFFRSGQRMTDQFRAGYDVDRERNNFESGIRDQIAEMYGVNALDIARIRQGLAEQGITGAQNVTLANANAGIF